MNQSRGGLPAKRKRDSKDLNAEDSRLFDLIHSKGDTGIVKREINRNRDLKMTSQKINNCIKSLMGMEMIKEIPDMNSKDKRYLSSEFEPSKSVTGGAWYDNGKLDTNFIETLKTLSLKALSDNHKVATVDGVRSFLKQVVKGEELSVEQVVDILDNLILEKLVLRVKSNGLGEFTSFPIGVNCYKLRQKGEKLGAVTSIPCGVCPRINHCHTDGIISPTTCEYFTKWLDF